jgi:hypothetical protein
VDRLATLPALELLLPGVGNVPRLAGVLLISEAAQLAPAAAVPPFSLLPRQLHVVVYCSLTGQLLVCRERVQEGDGCLYRHPRFDKWTWDNHGHWELLFPEADEHGPQIRLFLKMTAIFGTKPRNILVSAALAAPALAGGPAVGRQPGGTPQQPAPLAHLPWLAAAGQQRQQQSLPQPPQQQQQQHWSPPPPPPQQQWLTSGQEAPSPLRLAPPQNSTAGSHWQRQQVLVPPLLQPAADMTSTPAALSWSHGSSQVAGSPADVPSCTIQPYNAAASLQQMQLLPAQMAGQHVPRQPGQQTGWWHGMPLSLLQHPQPHPPRI